MASRRISGTGGSITLPSGHHVAVTAWSATVTQSVNDVSAFGTSPWSQSLGGLNSWRCSFSGFADEGAASTDPGVGATADTSPALASASATFTLQVSGGATAASSLTGTAVISDMAISVPFNGVVTVSGNAVGDGALVSTWSTT